jgi:hypothetical protein
MRVEASNRAAPDGRGVPEGDDERATSRADLVRVEAEVVLARLGIEPRQLRVQRADEVERHHRVDRLSTDAQP